MYLNPLSFCYQQVSQTHVFTSYPDPAISSKLHLPLNGFFQCFPYASKLISTLGLGEVSVWAKNLSRMCRWRGKSKGKLQRNGVNNCGYTISNSQAFSQGFLSQKFLCKTPYNFMGNESLNSVGKGMRKSTLKKLQAQSFACHSLLGLSCEVTCEIQPGKETLQILACTSHVAFHGLALASQSQASCEFFIFTELHQSLTHNPSIPNLFLIERKQFACALL